MQIRNSQTAMFLAALVLLLSGCNLPNIGPSAPCQVSVSKQAADRMIQRISQQVSVHGKTITITASNEEVSSALDLSLQQAKVSSPQSTMPLEHPVVCFQNGKMSIFGGLKWDTNGPVDAIVTLSAAVKNGKPAFTVQQIQVGPVTVPADLSDQLTLLVNSAVGQYLTQVTVTDIKLQNGQLSLTGQVP